MSERESKRERELFLAPFSSCKDEVDIGAKVEQGVSVQAIVSMVGALE